MKQHISPAQALEITEEQFYSIFGNQHWGIFRRRDYAHFHHKKVTIGKCIEVLGHYDAARIITDNQFENKELIDALWEAVKSVL